MDGRRHNTAFLAGLTQDRIPITIRADRAWSFLKVISVHPILEGIEK
jgi:hypothetical protein